MAQPCDVKEGKNIKINVLRKSCLLANCSVENVVHKFLVDTGSVSSILCKNVFMTLKNRPTLVETDLSLTAADGGRLNILGTADLHLTSGIIVFVMILLLQSLMTSMVFWGMDFLEQHDVKIHIAQGILTFADQQQVQLDKDYSPVCARVKLSKRVVIPPDSEVIIPGYAVGVKDMSVNNIVEPFQLLQKKSLLVARTLVNSENIQFSVANISSKPVKFEKHTTVATLQPVNSVQSNPKCESVTGD